MSQNKIDRLFKVPYLARMGNVRAAKEGVKLPTEDMILVVLRRAIAADVSAEAQSDWEWARGCRRARRARVRAREGKCCVTAPSSGG